MSIEMKNQSEMNQDKNKSFTERMAFLAKEEARIRAEREEAKREREELLKWKQERQKTSELDELKNKNPLRWLEEQGITYDKLTDEMTKSEDYKDGIVIKELRDQNNQLKKLMEETRNEFISYREEQTNRIKQAEKVSEDYQIKQYLNTLREHAKRDPEKFEFLNSDLISDDDLRELVVEIQTQYQEKTGQILDPEVVIDNIENHVANSYKENYNKLSSFKKIRPQQEPDELPLSQFEKDDETEYPEWMKRKTLSKNMPTSPSGDQRERYLSRDESLEMIGQKYSNLFQQEN